MSTFGFMLHVNVVWNLQFILAHIIGARRAKARRMCLESLAQGADPLGMEGVQAQGMGLGAMTVSRWSGTSQGSEPVFEG